MKRLHLVLLLTLIPVYICAQSQTIPSIWYAKAGAGGDGITADSPLGTSAEIETRTEPGDYIFLLPSDQPLDGGLTLREHQTLIGLTENGLKPIITNSSKNTNGGHGIILSNQNRVENIIIENTAASGIFGNSVSGSQIIGVQISGANQAGLSTQAILKALQGPFPHGGITLLNLKPKSSMTHRIVETEVLDAKAMGIGTFAANSSALKITADHVTVQKGDSLGRSDVGIGAFAEGPGSNVRMDIIDSSVKERMSLIGRNVIAFASAGASADVNFNRSHSGISGQDGVIGIAALLPAKVSIDITNSTIENAAQMNLEGTILHSPHFDSSRVSENLVSIDIENSTIQNAGSVQGFPNESRNIWMGLTPMRSVMQNKNFSSSLFPAGNYRLTIRNSQIAGAKDYGIGVGKPGSPPEPGNFDLLLRNNEVMNNGEHEFVISAPNIQLDARQNCWGTSEGLAQDKISLEGGVDHSNLDFTKALSCREEK